MQKETRGSDGFAVVADDDEDARLLVANLTRKFGLRVIEAGDGAELLACVNDLHAQDEKIALVISDIGMPECDGIEVTHRLLRSDPELTVVLMTAFADQHTVRRAKESGARHVLRKPFSLAVLERLLDGLQPFGRG